MQITCSSALIMETSSSNRRRRPSCSSTTSSSTSNGHLAGLERRLKKPLMEKRRRARINRCLSELTQILLNESLPPPPSSPLTTSSASPSVICSTSAVAVADHQKSKMEKADILEMTVQYLKNKRSTDMQVARRHFVDGFQQCSAAVLDFVRSRGAAGGPTATLGDEPRNWQTILAERLNEKLARSQNMLSRKMAPVVVHRPEPQRLLVNMPYTPTTPNSAAAFAYSPMMIGGGRNQTHHHQPAMLNPLSLPPTPPLGGGPFVGDSLSSSSRFFNFPSPKSSTSSRPSSAGSDASGSGGVWRPW